MHVPPIPPALDWGASVCTWGAVPALSTGADVCTWVATRPAGAWQPTPAHSLAAELPAAYDAGGTTADDASSTVEPTSPAAAAPSEPSADPEDPAHPSETADPASAVLARLRAIAEETARLDLDACSDEQLRRSLDELRRPLAMLEATRARLMAALEDRATRQVRPGGSTRGAKDEERRRSAERQRMTRSRAKREAEAGHAAREHVETGLAFTKGDVGPEHVRLIAELLTHVADDHRAEVEGRLLALAYEHEPVSFGRRARALLHELAPDRTAEADQREESRRELRMADTPDGSLVLSGRLHGTSAELVRVALDAFKRFDAPDRPRTTEQRNADALLQLCEVALKADKAPARHGARPHVVVLVRAEDLDGGAGPARFGFSGQPVNLDQARRLFSDCVVSRVAFAANGALIEASAGLRTVPPALYRALVARDGGCTWDGCDAPPSWCEVAHGNVPFRANEPLHSGDAALLCRRHHSRFDNGPYRMVIEGKQVRYLRLDAAGRPLGEPNPGANGPVRPTGPPGSNGMPGSTPTRGAATARHQPDRTDRGAADDAGCGAAPGTAPGRGDPGWEPASRRPGVAPPRAAPNAPPDAAPDTQRTQAGITSGTEAETEVGNDPARDSSTTHPTEDQATLFADDTG